MKRLLSILFLFLFATSVTTYAMEQGKKYYDVLGVSKDATREEITRHTENWL